MNVGITGSSGFIGSAVMQHFKERGENAIVLDRLVHPNSRRDDLSFPPELDWVLHFGATKSVEASFDNPLETYRRNLNSTMAALEIALATQARFLYMCSYVYGKPRYLPIDELHPVAVLNPYMGSKLLGEDLCSHLHQCLGISVLVLRGFTFYGPGQRDEQLIASIVRSIRAGKPITVRDPDPRRDHLHVADLGQLVHLIVRSNFSGYGIYNVGGGVSYSNIEVATMANEIAWNAVPIHVEGVRRKNDIMECYANIGKVSGDFGWHPEIHLEDGLRDCLNVL